MPRRNSLCSQMRNSKVMNPFLQLDHKPRRLSLPCVPELKIVRHAVTSLNFFLKPRCSYETVQSAKATKCADVCTFEKVYTLSSRLLFDHYHPPHRFPFLKKKDVLLLVLHGRFSTDPHRQCPPLQTRPRLRNPVKDRTVSR